MKNVNFFISIEGNFARRARSQISIPTRASRSPALSNDVSLDLVGPLLKKKIQCIPIYIYIYLYRAFSCSLICIWFHLPKTSFLIKLTINTPINEIAGICLVNGMQRPHPRSGHFLYVLDYCILSNT